MIHAYSQLYLSKASHSVGNMLHYAVVECGMDGGAFLNLFIFSGVASQFENENPEYIAGKSGQELLFDVIELTSKGCYSIEIHESFERTPAYWVGWMLVHYQWYSGRSFMTILDTIPYNELLGLYSTLHEADIQKSYEVLDVHFSESESRLKIVRKKCGLTQEELASESGVSLNTIRAYERRSKDINKAQLNIILRLCDALKCNVGDISE